MANSIDLHHADSKVVNQRKFLLKFVSTYTCASMV